MHVLLITTLRAEQTYFRKKRRLYTKRETTVRAKSDVCLQTRTYIYETRGIRAITWRHVIIITTLRAECVVMCAHLSLSVRQFVVMSAHLSISVLICALSSSVLKYKAPNYDDFACRMCRYLCSFVLTVTGYTFIYGIFGSNHRSLLNFVETRKHSNAILQLFLVSGDFGVGFS